MGTAGRGTAPAGTTNRKRWIPNHTMVSAALSFPAGSGS